MNQAAVRQYGYSENEFLSLRIDDIRPEEDIARLLENVSQHRTGLQQPSQWRHRRIDGTIIDVEIVAHEVVYQGSDGELVAAYDITDRLRSQQLLRDSEAKYRVLFEDSSEAYWLLSDDGYVDSNAAALEMFGFSQKAEFTHPADCSPPCQPDGMASRLAADARISSALLTGSETFEWIHQRKNGELFPAEVRLSALQLSGRQLLLATVRDVTERRRGERALALQTAILKAQSETTLDGILAVDENDHVIFANPQFAAHFGIPPEIVESRDDMSVRNFVAQSLEEPQTFLRTIEALYSQPERRSTDEIHLANGKTFERYSAPLNESGGCHRGRIWYFHEITDRRAMETALREAEERYRTIFENAGIGIFRATPDGCPVTVNRAIAQIHGFDSAEELLDSISNVSTQLFVNPGDMQALVAAAAEREIVEGAEVEVFSKTQTRKWIRVNCHAIRNTHGKLEYVDGTVEDITERKLAESRVETLAYYDALTGLANRSLLHDRIAHALAAARRARRKIAVLFIDLDRFKFINDSLGHTVGDLLLKEVASRLTRLIRAEDTVARIGGDEFVIVMGNIDSPRDAEVVATRILEQISSTALIDGHSLHVSCSIGICLYPENGPDRETLIRYADQAMYAAKESGRDAYRFFSADLNDQIQIEASIEQDLRKALRDGEFSLNYQPQMAIRTGRLAGMEALLRWQHSSKGLIPPNVFIEIAENTGLILPIGNWALRNACEQAKKWHTLGILNVPVAVNISAVQFRQKGFCDLIATTLQETRLPPQLLELELTESLLLLNRDSILSILATTTGNGCWVGY